MYCPHCQRPVKFFNLRRSSLLKKVLPRCGACHRYVLHWGHRLAVASVALVASLVLLKLLRIL